jgi:hypothetical protein
MKVSTTTLLFSALSCVLLAAPALAQMQQADKWAKDPRQETDAQEQKKNGKEIEREYNAVVKRVNPQTTSAASDPWANIRPSAPAKEKQ